NHPVTGYGYITAGRPIDELTQCFEIDKLIEKPESEVAAALIESGKSYWNAGIFVGYPEVFLAALEVQRPEIVQVCREAIKNGKDDLDFYRPHGDQFQDIQPISIDHAVMEHTRIGAVVQVEMEWSDVGSWMALWDLMDKDLAENVARGPVHQLGTQRC